MEKKEDDKILIFGGTGYIGTHMVKASIQLAVLNYEEDVGMLTIKVATDPRTRNRVVIYRPGPNIISQLELISSRKQKSCPFQKFYQILRIYQSPSSTVSLLKA